MVRWFRLASFFSLQVGTTEIFTGFGSGFGSGGGGGGGNRTVRE